MRCACGEMQNVRNSKERGLKKTEKLGETDINELKLSIRQILSEVYQKKENALGLDVSQKKDGTIVTEIDQKISALVKDKLRFRDPDGAVQFYCEEFEERGDLQFPALVLDPIDGTRELAKGLEECCLSLAHLESSRIDHLEGFAWLYNPFTGFELSSEAVFFEQKAREKATYLGLVSRSEYEAGLFSQLEATDDVQIIPRGSIAFKLGLLASGACDFVISRRPKNIWDIAAGTILCRQRNIYLYSKNGQINNWSDLYCETPLLWCHPSLQARLRSLFHS